MCIALSFHANGDFVSLKSWKSKPNIQRVRVMTQLFGVLHLLRYSVFPSEQISSSKNIHIFTIHTYTFSVKLYLMCTYSHLTVMFNIERVSDSKNQIKTGDGQLLYVTRTGQCTQPKGPGVRERGWFRDHTWTHTQVWYEHDKMCHRFTWLTSGYCIRRFLKFYLNRLSHRYIYVCHKHMCGLYAIVHIRRLQSNKPHTP